MSGCSNKALGQKHGKLEMALIDYDVSYRLARGLYLISHVAFAGSNCDIDRLYIGTVGFGRLKALKSHNPATAFFERPMLVQRWTGKGICCCLI